MIPLLYIILCVVWGSSWTAVKIGLQDAPPIWSSGLRITIAGLILLIYNLAARNSFPRGWRQKWKVAWPGILMFGCSYFMVYWGMQYISSALGSILFAAFPFFIIIFIATIFKYEKITLLSIIGVLIGFSGIIIIFAGPINMDNSALFGAVLLVLATSASAYSTVHIKVYLGDQPILPMITMQMILGGVLTLIVALATEDLGRFNATFASVGSILYLATFGTILTFVGYYWLLRKISTVTLSLMTFISPIVAVFLGYLILNESLTTQDFIGSALVLTGVILTGTRK